MSKENDNKPQLAITTIGDLLLRNKITSEHDKEGSIKLRIPAYQRPYKWTARNAVQLLNDIIDAMNGNKEKYRVGTLILHRTEDGHYDIVDGQQRTITFALLLRALDKEKAVSFLKQEVSANEYNRCNISNNFRALSRRVGKTNESAEAADYEKPGKEQESKRLLDYVCDRCELIVVTTPDISAAFQFFDSQNARGKALYPHDLLKAYHLREMAGENEAETERIVKEWEHVSQQKLAEFFGDYLYRIKEWVNGDKAGKFSERNIQMFKGVSRYANSPYAQFYKAAYCYADMVNSSTVPFVAGIRGINAFQLNTPVIAGRPFFEYTRHYYGILKDIQDNSKYEGFYINDNEIVKTLDEYFNSGEGNGIVRLLFDTSALLYVDRFCPETYPSREDMAQFEQFVVYAFVWAYSLRAQYIRLGWASAQNYIMGESNLVNSFNIYRMIVRHDTPTSLLSALADKICTLTYGMIRDRQTMECSEVSGKGKKLEELKDNEVYTNYLYFFQNYGFIN